MQEGLIFVALQCYPPPAAPAVALAAAAAPALASPPDAGDDSSALAAMAGSEEAALAESVGMVAPAGGGLTAGHVLTAVGRLLSERVLKHAKHGDVLEFRRKIAGSFQLSEAFDAIRPLIDPLFARYAKEPRLASTPSRSAAKGPSALAGGGPPVGEMSLKRFLEMCTDAELIGSQLSRNQAMMAFVNSLQFSADEVTRAPLLSRDTEFDEALVRLAWAHGGSPTGPGKKSLMEAIGTPKGNRKHNRFSTLVAVNTAASTISQAVRNTISTKRGEGEGAVDAETSEMESAVLARLPELLGRLLALMVDQPGGYQGLAA